MRGRPKSVGRLTQIRLSDVDVTIRRRAARAAVAERLDPFAAPEDRLLGALFSLPDDRIGSDERDALEVALRRAAENPSDRAYWVPESAVRAVLG
jgi:hypothetical protein